MIIFQGENNHLLSSLFVIESAQLGLNDNVWDIMILENGSDIGDGVSISF